MKYARLWLGLGVAVLGSFVVLGYYGAEIYRQAPPVPPGIAETQERQGAAPRQHGFVDALAVQRRLPAHDHQPVRWTARFAPREGQSVSS